MFAFINALNSQWRAWTTYCIRVILRRFCPLRRILDIFLLFYHEVSHGQALQEYKNSLLGHSKVASVPESTMHALDANDDCLRRNRKILRGLQAD